MWDSIKSVLKQYAGSKKAVAAAVSCIAWGAAKVGWSVDSEQLALAIGPLWLYIAALALEDHGKAKAKIEAAKPE